eukprot:TRINITY_DN27793_c0_g1_i1.p1 TRINITY_DN27793_c0_g1~~TRINITY_DN27793_c0_g1_i1.p1  ORF type:complete len:428 (+),score=63.04 TRINITY_DN27793_c0_g1_i1:212-1495(+)
MDMAPEQDEGSPVVLVEMTSLVPATTWSRDASDVPDFESHDARLAWQLHEEELREARNRPTPPDRLGPDEQLAMELYEQELAELETGVTERRDVFEIAGVPLFRPDKAYLNGVPLSHRPTPPSSVVPSASSAPSASSSATSRLVVPSSASSSGSMSAAASARAQRPVDRARSGAALSEQLKQVRRERLASDRERAAQSLRTMQQQPAGLSSSGAGPVSTPWTTSASVHPTSALGAPRSAPKAAPNWRNTRFGRQRVWTLDDINRLRLDELDANAAYKADASPAAHARSGGAFQSLSNMFNDPERVGKDALRFTNEFRARHHLPPLEWHPTLFEIGAKHSKDMGDFRVPFSHDGFDSRVRQYPMWHSAAAENLALNAGSSDPARVAVDGWIASPGHCKNLLHAGMQWCGIGVYRNAHGTTYLTQLFSG